MSAWIYDGKESGLEAFMLKMKYGVVVVCNAVFFFCLLGSKGAEVL